MSAPLDRCGAVVVAHARTDLARECVASLRRWLPPDRIVVVLNDPAAAGPHADDLLGREARVMSPAVPQGYGANVNLGVHALGAEIDYCVLSNDDVVYQPGSLERLVDVLARDDTIGVVGPTIDQPPQAGDPGPFRHFPSFTPGLNDALLPRPLTNLLLRRAPDTPAVSNGVAWILGAAMVVRMSAFAAVDGFDEDFFLYFEEIDLCYRMACAGWRCEWCETARAFHAQGASIPPDLSRVAPSRRLYLKKRLGPARWPFFEFSLTAFFVVSVAYACAAAVIRPRSAKLRFELLAYTWRNRVFLRRSHPERARR